MEFPFRTDSFLVYRFVKVYFQKSSRIFMDLNLKKKKKKQSSSICIHESDESNWRDKIKRKCL